MMTCRSRLAFATLGLVTVLGRVEAQDTLQLPQTVPQQRTHVVQTGETLWALSERYLGDALLWPAIYRLNTLVVEDPHWIYPGEELQLGEAGAVVIADVGAGEARADTIAAQGPDVQADTVGRVADTLAVDTTQVAPPPPPELPPAPPPPGGDVPTIFARGATAGRSIFSGRIIEAEYRAVIPATFYGAGFLTEEDRFPWADIVGAIGKPAIEDLSAVSARVFESIELRVPQGASYHIGDSLLVARLGREVPDWGRIVEPTAIARVREVSARRVVADILSQWSRVSGDQVAMPVEPFRTPAGTPPVPVENGMSGVIITPRALQSVTSARQVVFINLGRADGVALGDVFEVLRPNPPEASPEAPLQQLALIQIVHVRQQSASGLLIQMSDIGVGPGSPVRLIRKMPS
jgi:hypothetical protein